MAKKYTQDFKQKMVDLYASGISSKKLAKEHEVSDCTIITWVRNAGGFVRPSRPRYSQEFKQQMIDLYLGGASSYSLEKIYKVDDKAIERWVLSFKGSLHPRLFPARSQDFKRKILDLYVSGMSSYQILKEYGISPENTCRWAREFGVPLRRRFSVLSDNGTKKSCSMCELTKPIDDFSFCPSGVAGRNPWCRDCQKSFRRQKTYKLSPEEFDELLKNQGGVCAVCKEKPEEGRGFGKGWHIDHDHSCCPSKGKTCGQCVRGVLCSACNSGLGQFKDNEIILQNAISYIQGYRSTVLTETKTGA